MENYGGNAIYGMPLDQSVYQAQAERAQQEYHLAHPEEAIRHWSAVDRDARKSALRQQEMIARANNKVSEIEIIEEGERIIAQTVTVGGNIRMRHVVFCCHVTQVKRFVRERAVFPDSRFYS